MTKTLLALNSKPTETVSDIHKAQNVLIELMQLTDSLSLYEMGISIRDIAATLIFLKEIESQAKEQAKK